MTHLSIIIPVYKAEKCLPELYRRLKLALNKITTDHEIIFVEDCGGDNSWDLILNLARKDRKVKGLQLCRNFGQHAAITAGMDYCDSDWTIVMDCDLQDRPEEIPKLYGKAMEGYEVVVARRGKRKDGLLKRGTSLLFYKIFKYLSGFPYDEQVGNFRIFSRKVALHFKLMRENLRFFGGLMQWMDFPFASVDVQHAPRYEGKTSYTYLKLFQLGVETIIAYSDKPLQLSVQIGFLMSFLAFIGGSYIFYMALVHNISISGWGSLMVSLYFIGGLIISILGILGIYLGKTFNETKKRPLYIVQELIHFKKN
jgi:dolichol-phosphate mannosyltransferase